MTVFFCVKVAGGEVCHSCPLVRFMRAVVVRGFVVRGHVLSL